jgi:predicted RNase H-like nuclease (RuvC/YqgF family)
MGISQSTLRRRIDKGEIESKLDDGRRLILVNTDNHVVITEEESLQNENEQLKRDIEKLRDQIIELELQDDKKVGTTERESLKTENERITQELERRDNQIAELQADNRYLREELRQKGQLVAVAQNTAQQLIERLQTPFWKRWFRRQKALPAPEDVVDMESEDDRENQS